MPLTSYAQNGRSQTGERTNQPLVAPPHFHAVYGGQYASIAIETLELLDGRHQPERADRAWGRRFRLPDRRPRACATSGQLPWRTAGPRQQAVGGFITRYAF